MEKKSIKINQSVRNNIAFLSDFSTWGGMEIVTKNLVETDSNLFWGIINLSNKEHNPLFKNIRNKISIDNMDDLPSTVLKNNISHIVIQLFNLEKTLKIINLLKEKTCVKIIFFLHNTPSIFYKYCSPFYKCFRYSKTPSVYDRLKEEMNEILRTHISYPKKRAKTFPLIEKIIQQIDLFLLLTPNMVKELKKYTNKTLHHKINFIYNVIPEYTEYQNKQKENTIILAARLVPIKGGGVVIKSLHNILEKYPNWKLFILGDGEEFNEIQNFISKEHLNNVILTGKINNVHEYLSKSKINILYSVYEGLPTILLEAGKLNNVLISYHSIGGGTKEIIENNKNGFLVHHGGELAKKVEFLIKNPKKLEEMAKYNNIHLTKFNTSNVLSKWKDFIQSL